MSLIKIYKITFYLAAFSALTGCSGSGSEAIDKLLGSFSSTPILSSIPNQTISQEDLLKVDVNNIKEGDPGNDSGMSYTCSFDTEVDAVVDGTKDCTQIPNSTVTFDQSSGILSWTPHSSTLGNYEIKITGTNTDGVASQIFTVGVRLKFNGVGLYTQITGNSVTVNWTPNLDAQGYQIFKLNTLTGQYELFKSLTGGSTSGTTLTGLTPNTGYTLRVQAIDALGNPDGNVVSRAFTTTELVKLGISSDLSTAAAGTAVHFTIQAYNANDTVQTVGGLPITASIASGTSSGNFSSVTDNNDGTYSFTFTPSSVGSAVTFDLTTNITFFLKNTVTLTVIPGAPSSAHSTLSIGAATVISGNNVTLSASLHDAYNNAITTGTVSFSKSGGTSTGNFSAVSDSGNGLYTTNYTGLTAGSAQTLTVSVDGVSLSLSTSVQVLPGAPFSGNSTLAVSTASLPSGSDATVTATLKDINNNPVPSGILVSFSKSGGTSSGSFGTVVNAGSGVYTTTYTGVTAGTAQTLSVTVDGVTLIPVVSISVVPGAPSLANSSFTLSSASVVSGNFITLTATLKDANSNPIDSGVSVDFTKTGGTSTGNFGTVTNQGAGVYNVRYTAVKSGTAQDLKLQVAGSDFGPTLQVSVLNGSPSPTHSTLSLSSNTVVSGQSVTLTATLKDNNDNTISSGVAVSFAKTGGTSTGNFDSVTNAGNGVYTTTYTGLTAGTAQTVSLLVDSSALGPASSITVTVGAPSAANSSLSLGASTVIAGQSVTLTATIKDSNNNPISSGVTVAFSKTGGTSTGVLSAVTNQGGGIYTATYTGNVAGSAQTISVAVDSVDLGFTPTLTVNPGTPSATTSTLSISSGTVTSGASVTLTATVKDANSNPITSGVAVTFSKTGGTSTGSFGAITNAGSGVYTTTYTGTVAGSAQTINILVDGFNLGPTVTVAVVPGAPSSLLSTLSISSNTVIAGQFVTLTATIKDSNSNPVSSGILVTFDKFSGSSFGNYATVANQGNGVYTVTYTGITAGTSQTVQANVDGAGFGPTQSIQVLVGAPSAAHSTLTLGATSISSGTSTSVSALIRDSQNNPITNQYAITFDSIGGSSTGSLAAVSNNGSGTFSTTYSGQIAGSAQTLRVLADGTPISGLTAAITVVPGTVSVSNSTFTISSPSVQAGASASLLMNLRDANNNAISSGSTVVSFTKSSGVSDGTIGSVTNSGSGNYSASYTATTMGTAQTVNLFVNSVNVGMSVSVTVTAGPPTHFGVVTPGSTLNSIDCNGPYTLTLKDANENTTTSTSTVSISLASNPAGSHSGTIFSDAACSNSVTSFSIPAAVTTLQFYYKSYIPKNFTLGLTPSGGISVTNISILNVAVLSWIGSSAYFTMNGGGSNTVQDDTSGGLMAPSDVVISGNYLYSVDSTGNRILKYDTSTNTLIGWIGHVGSTENLTAYDGSADCSGLNIADLTPKWCNGGRSNTVTASVISAPHNIAADSTYIYVSSGHRILRFLQSDGSYQGWFGKISTTAATSPASCVSAGTNVTTPTWCFGGTNTTGTGDGQFNNVYGLVVQGNYLYASDYSNHRVQRIDISDPLAPAYAGWVGQALTSPPSTSQLSTCSSPPSPAEATPGWCLGGTSQLSKRYNLAGPSPGPEASAPNEGFYNPYALGADGTYLYITDYNNYRLVKVNLATGAFSGWVGYVLRSTAGKSPTTPTQTNGTYTSDWVQGGVTSNATGTNGFGGLTGLMVDTSSTPSYIYLSDTYHRVIRIRASDGQDYRWLGRASTSPTGGYTGCSSTPVGGVNPGWCFGGGANKFGNTNGSFYSPLGLAFSSSKIYVADSANFRIQRFNKADGTFDGWIGAGNIQSTKWSRSIASGAIASRAGIDDYSVGDTTAFNGLTGNGNYLFETDSTYHRIKKFNLTDGSVVGYIGQISAFPPTGPDDCVGYTSGMTPTWCTGGGRTTSGAGIQAYNNPYSVASDSSYVYIGNYSDHRIDRVRISDGLYMGWIGKVNGIPTDGDSGCLSVSAGSPTPGWCIGGSATSGSLSGQYNAPRSLYYDKLDGYLYAIDATARLIRIQVSDGSFVAAIGSVTAATGCTPVGGAADRWCSAATGNNASNVYGAINSGNGIAANTNYLYVVDASNHRLLRFDKSLGAPAGFVGKMNNATNLNTSAATFTVNGVTTVNGCQGLSGYPKATPGWCLSNTLGQSLSTTSGTDAFNTPRGVWADETNIYVADSGNNRIVKLDAATGNLVGWKGFITSTTGMTDPACIAAGAGNITPTWCTGGTSGPGKQLGAFDNPSGISGDDNYLYVIDNRNNRILTVPKN